MAIKIDLNISSSYYSYFTNILGLTKQIRAWNNSDVTAIMQHKDSLFQSSSTIVTLVRGFLLEIVPRAVKTGISLVGG